MTKVLITGATGNVGTAVIHSLVRLAHKLEIYAGVRNINSDSKKFEGSGIKFVTFDFTNIETYKISLAGCDIFYLLRPPQIADVEKYFKPLIDTCLELHIQHVVFLSVQGVENSKIIPHHKIEKLIVESKIPYTFLRPAYFMQNYTSTLHSELVKNKRIYLPAGQAKFTLIDVRDIGAVSAAILTNISQHINTAYELTSKEKLTFSEMAKILSNILGITISFKSPNLIRFFMTQRKAKTPIMMILVMIMLHYLPRFQKEPATTDWVEKITGKAPIGFEEFVKDFKEELLK